MFATVNVPPRATDFPTSVAIVAPSFDFLDASAIGAVDGAMLSILLVRLPIGLFLLIVCGVLGNDGLFGTLKPPPKRGLENRKRPPLTKNSLYAHRITRPKITCTLIETMITDFFVTLFE